MPCGSIICLGRDAQDRQDLITPYMLTSRPLPFRLPLCGFEVPSNRSKVSSKTSGSFHREQSGLPYSGQSVSRAAVYDCLSHSTRNRLMRAGESHILSCWWRAARMVTCCAPSTVP
jgi:hypothetical protein